jgi:hypothetical protein
VYLATCARALLPRLGESASTAPTIESESESSIAEHGATQEAQINPEGSETQYELWIECVAVYTFQCGSAERVGSGHRPASDSGHAVSAVVSHLEHGDSYKYWVVTANSEGTTTSAVRIFTPSENWPGPVSATGAASNVSQMSATMGGPSMSWGPPGWSSPRWLRLAVTRSYDLSRGSDGLSKTVVAVIMATKRSRNSPPTSNVLMVGAVEQAEESTEAE